jgi:hypothetical protein
MVVSAPQKNARMEPPLYSCTLSFSMAAYAGQPNMPGMTDPDLELAIRVMIDRGATDEEMIAATKDAITHMRAVLGKPGGNPHKLRQQRAELARAFGRPSPHMRKRSSGRRTAILGIAGAAHKEALFDPDFVVEGDDPAHDAEGRADAPFTDRGTEEGH